MIYRLWTTGVDPAQLDRYREFARERSVPMFREQPGFRDVVFLQDGDEHWVLTVWDSMADVDALATSRSYVATAKALGATGILTGEQRVRILAPEVAAGPLGAAPRA